MNQGPKATENGRAKEGKPQAAATVDARQPSNIDAEEGVIGSLLRDPAAFDEIADVLYVEDFFDDGLGRIYGIVRDMRANDQRLTQHTLLAEIVSRKATASCSAQRLGKIATSVRSANYLGEYANKVIEEAARRELIAAANEAIEAAANPDIPARTALGEAETKLAAITERRTQTKARALKELLFEGIERAVKRDRGEIDESGVRTGFGDLDKLTGGLHASELVILAARPSVGKTSFAMNVAWNVSQQAIGDRRGSVLFVSLEMSQVEVANRMLSSEARVDGHLLRTRGGGKYNIDRMKALYGDLSGADLYVEDNPTRVVSSIAASARIIRRRAGALDLIVIDYLQLLHPDDKRAPRQEQVASQTRQLKALARNLNVPVLCLAQLNRQVESSGNSRPKLSHLRESGAIEQDADVVLFVHREAAHMPPGEARDAVESKAEIIIAKQRNGPQGEIPLVWSPQYTRFDTKAPDRHGEFDDFNRGERVPDEYLNGEIPFTEFD